MNGIASMSNMDGFECLGQTMHFFNNSTQHGDLAITGVPNTAAASAKPKGSGRTGNTPNGRRSQGGRRKDTNGGVPVAMPRSSVPVAMPRSDEAPISPRHDDEKRYGIKMDQNISDGQILPYQRRYQPQHPHQQPQHQGKQQDEKEEPEQPFHQCPMNPIDGFDRKVVWFNKELHQRTQYQQNQQPHKQTQQQSKMKPLVQTPSPNAKIPPHIIEFPLVSQGQRPAAIEMSPSSCFPEGNQVVCQNGAPIPAIERHDITLEDLDIYFREMNNPSIGGSTYSLGSSNTSSQISSSPDMVSFDDSNPYDCQQPISVEQPFHISPVSNGPILIDAPQKRRLDSVLIDQENPEKKRKQEPLTLFDVGMVEQNNLQSKVQSPELSILQDAFVEADIDPNQFFLLFENSDL